MLLYSRMENTSPTVTVNTVDTAVESPQIITWFGWHDTYNTYVCEYADSGRIPVTV